MLGWRPVPQRKEVLARIAKGIAHTFMDGGKDSKYARALADIMVKAGQKLPRELAQVGPHPVGPHPVGPHPEEPGGAAWPPRSAIGPTARARSWQHAQHAGARC